MPATATSITRRYPAFLAPLLLAGCASVPDLGPAPSLRTPETVAAARSLPATPGAEWPQAGSWASFGDSQLARLIEEALGGSPDVRAALARVRRAAALAQEAGAARLPTVTGEGQLTLDKQSVNNGIPAQILPNGWRNRAQLAGLAEFDLDFWGRNRAALAAAVSEQRAAAVEAAQARLLLTSAVAMAYSDFATSLAEQDVRSRAVEVRQASRDLLARRLASGLENRGSLRQAEAEVASARAALAQTTQAVAVRRHQVAALLGAGPDRGLEIARPALGAVPLRALPAAVTTELVGRRPDIVGARERTAAAAARIKVARADFYPAISLGALVGLQSLGLGDLARSGSVYGSVGPAVSLPIFRGGAIEGRYRAARAGFDEAVADYDRAVVEAYRQVADAVSAREAAARRLAEGREALAAIDDAYRVAQRRYRAGLSNYLDVLAVEDRLLAARLAVATSEAELRSGELALLRALGGGYAGEGVAGPETEGIPDA